jgi:hypothetical protein
MRMNATSVLMLFDRPHNLRARLGNPVCPPIAFFDLRIRANKPIEQYSTARSLFELPSESFKMRQRSLRSIPFSRLPTSFPWVRFDIDQQQDGTTHHTSPLKLVICI